MRIVLILVLMSILLSGCYSGFVRYDCQKFENWKKAECNPPACLPEGLCTKDLFDKDLWEEVKKYER